LKADLKIMMSLIYVFSALLMAAAHYTLCDEASVDEAAMAVSREGGWLLANYKPLAGLLLCGIIVFAWRIVWSVLERQANEYAAEELQARKRAAKEKQAMECIVKEKQADIAILRTMGASPGDVMRIFMVQGTLIGAIGVHGVDVRCPVIIFLLLAPGSEQDSLPIGRPGRNVIGLRIRGQLNLPGAIGVHSPDIEIAGPIALEDDFLAIRRPTRPVIYRLVIGEVDPLRGTSSQQINL
jgi:hypothetical protein